MIDYLEGALAITAVVSVFWFTFRKPPKPHGGGSGTEYSMSQPPGDGHDGFS